MSRKTVWNSCLGSVDKCTVGKDTEPEREGGRRRGVFVREMGKLSINDCSRRSVKECRAHSKERRATAGDGSLVCLQLQVQVSCKSDETR